MSSNRTSKASLILDDGTVYKGKLFGASKCVAGEVGKFIKLFWGPTCVESERASDGLNRMPLKHGPSALKYQTGRIHSCYEMNFVHFTKRLVC